MTYFDTVKFVAEKHGKQKYPGTKLPYMMHLTAVAMEITSMLCRDFT